MEFDNHNYNKHLQFFANKLRKEMTKAEASLWKYVLRAKKMNGYQFRRQRPVLNYIVDFVCLELMLVIEIDGSSHCVEKTVNRDQIKQTDLEAAGYTVLRFSDHEVLNCIHSVERFIMEWIEKKVGV